MNKLVLATNLPDIEGYPNLFNSNSAEEWNKILKQNNKSLNKYTSLNRFSGDLENADKSFLRRLKG